MKNADFCACNQHFNHPVNRVFHSMLGVSLGINFNVRVKVGNLLISIYDFRYFRISVSESIKLIQSLSVIKLHVESIL